ncbi:MAG: ABC transporter ATP-binding protein, partial [Bacteroidota bacterium]|nr:ABC transporter ATP-binding protein [Bacteroidota bacterium]
MSDINKYTLITQDLEIGFPKPPGKPNISLMKGISVTAKKGELIAMIGQNGIGKSTLLRTLVQLQPALSGNVILNNINIEKYTRRELARQVGFVSTEIINAGNLNVYDLVALGRFPYTNWFGTINKEDQFMIDHSIELVDLVHKRDKMLTEISDGERQRAMIARTLSQ